MLCIEFFYNPDTNKKYKLAVSQFNSDPMTLICWLEYPPSSLPSKYVIQLFDTESEQIIEEKKITANNAFQLLGVDRRDIFKYKKHCF
ncbi:hypothetical protein VT25_05365 [Photobacterium leiognathi subsp. mandapamensis]|nr:hypothetical protein VT25_05365 [Photobacterium leiognathi subsp. mandapamensis]